MPRYRQDRINEEISRSLAEIFREVKDPRVSEAFVSVTGVDCAADLSVARVYVSALGTDMKPVIRGLESASGFIRGQLSARVKLRITPALKFIPDTSIAHGADINKLLRSVEDDLKEPQGAEEPENGAEDKS